jgi:hypothetical protein
MIFADPIQVSLAPGFSPVDGVTFCPNRFSGFTRTKKPLKRLNYVVPRYTGLKPGANEGGDSQSEIANRKS